MLPKFLLADNSQVSPENIYVVHSETPRCIFECHIDDEFIDNYKVFWIDAAPANQDAINTLAVEAGKFLDDELDAQEKLFEDQYFDEDFDEEEEEEEEK